MQRKFLLSAAAAVSALLTLPANASVVTYSFTRIADSQGEFGNFRTPSINNSGQVAVIAERDFGAGQSVIVGDGLTVTTLYNSTGSLTDPTINSSGDVAFRAGSSRQIFLSSGGATQTLVDDAGPFFVVGTPVINDAGEVAFSATRDNGVQEIGAALSGALSTLVDNTGPLSNMSLGSNISSNNHGEVAFISGFDSVGNSQGIFVTDGATTNSVADNLTSNLDFFRSPSLNDNGQVAFVADDFDPATAALRGVYLFDSGSVMTIADDTGVFNVFGDASINNKGDVAFLSFMDDGRQSVNVFSDGLIQTILSSGDTLDGLLVLSIMVFQGGPTQFINDSGQVTFVAQLEGGINAVYRASVDQLVSEVPLPAAAWVFLAGLGGLSVTRKRQSEGNASAS